LGQDVCHINCGTVTEFAAEIGIMNMKNHAQRDSSND